MKTQYIFGGAIVSLNVEPASEGTPVNPEVVRDLQSFLSLMDKVYVCGLEHYFGQLLRGFAEEVDVYLDNSRMEQIEDPYAHLDDSTRAEIERFMDSKIKKRKR